MTAGTGISDAGFSGAGASDDARSDAATPDAATSAAGANAEAAAVSAGTSESGADSEFTGSSGDAEETGLASGTGPAAPARLAVAKTCKLYIGGAFPRSESGRVQPVHDTSGTFLGNVAEASRKDARDAVSAARKAFPGWSGATAHNRGQVLFRIAEVMEGRRDQFRAEVAAAEGVGPAAAASLVDTAIDRVVWFAGWTDKIATALGSVNPVAGPYFSFSVPEPTGVVAVLAPQESALLGLVSVLAPALAAGNTCVVLAAAERPLPAVTLSEVLATSDVPPGAVNLLTGHAAEPARWLAAHADVNAIDPTGAPPQLRAELEAAAAGTIKRVLPVRSKPDDSEPDWTAAPGIDRLRAFTELKTIWHPVGT